MKDFFKRYHRHKVLSHIGIVALSVVFAFGANAFLFSSNTGPMLKANVLEASQNNASGVDFVGEYASESIQFSSNTEMKDVTEVSFTLVYNPEEITLGNAEAEENLSLTTLENTPGVKSYILHSSAPQDIMAGDILMQLDVSMTENAQRVINMLNVNFGDSSGEMYHLSSEGIVF